MGDMGDRGAASSHISSRRYLEGSANTPMWLFLSRRLKAVEVFLAVTTGCLSQVVLASCSVHVHFHTPSKVTRNDEAVIVGNTNPTSTPRHKNQTKVVSSRLPDGPHGEEGRDARETRRRWTRNREAEEGGVGKIQGGPECRPSSRGRHRGDCTSFRLLGDMRDEARREEFSSASGQHRLPYLAYLPTYLPGYQVPTRYLHL
ncbi:hypothetical protein GGTG_11144 [Gaeumannomyces tritici R3-111a-1]|uniref:Uncharacterized protein n=1 Tax=Gaeumannomyces tritici (strain R3-111a-1) TaxID=644352 RepID=J3PCC1_GAET3|nr:hypothetical protein GGTG_11144 [Gaeumannomyces tritici R3-111a-1]EJT71891.1 hypothetical protein GGTG_11144 [Gaeumannomyces tritici R3-111a-1]